MSRKSTLTRIAEVSIIFAAVTACTVAAPSSTPAPRAGEERSFGDAPMVFVPEGEFLMGSTDAQILAATDDLLHDCVECRKSSGFYTDQAPQHAVFLDAFWIDKYEVTNALYGKCVDAEKCAAPLMQSSFSRNSYFLNAEYDSFPVIYVSWADANAYCEWAGKRLPTEAEWEKAARGSDGRVFPWGDNWYAADVNAEERIRETAAVGSYPKDASPFGVLDMAGNVREWVADWYDETYYAASPHTNPPGAPSGQYRVLRGGSWGGYKVAARSASRAPYEPITREHYIGFRCAKTLD